MGYRPFDLQWIFFHDEMIERSRKEIMRHMLEENIGIITVRQVAEGKFNHINITTNIIESRITLSNKGIAYLFPLFLYSSTDKKDLFSEHESGEKKPNIKPELFEELKKNYKKEVAPEEIFYYIYGVLYSNTYRTKYAEFLKIDFPRVPFTKDYKLFIQLGKLGKQLSDLHLLKSKELDNTISRFPIDGSKKVERPNYEDEKVWINKEQYFNNVKEEVWEYQIGGYQVCDKWLKDRKGRVLTLDEILTYCKIVTALSKTIELQNEIDKYFENIEKTI
ncbi:MAG: type ISP restriction/modification enzyme [Ignavibacteriaceae bacterium]